MSGNSRRYVIVTPFKKVDVLAGICKIHGLDVWVVPSKQGAMVVHDLPVPVFDDWDISELLGGEQQSDDIIPIEGQESLFDSSEAAGADPAGEVSAGEAAPDSSKADREQPEDSTSADAPAEESDDAEKTGAAALSADDKEGVARALAKLSRAGVILLTSELGEDVGLEEGVSGIITALVYDSDGTATETPAGLIVATSEEILEDLLLGNRVPEKIKGAVRSGEFDTTAIERLAGGAPGSETPLPPRRPRRLFGRDK